MDQKIQLLFRRKIINLILPNFRRDEKLYLLVGDMGFAVIDNLKKEFPERVINCGIMEPGMVGIAAGMAMSGLKPIVYTIVNFLVFRCLEQIRNDVVLQNLNVKFVGTGANNYFKQLGPSHCCGKDDIKLMKIIGVKVFDPYSSKDSFKKVIKEWISFPGPAYIRV